MLLNNIKYQFLLIPLVSVFIQAEDYRWGWEVHRYINEYAVDYLPAEMSFFQDQRDFLRQHATDPDTDQLPGYYHYIDIDYYYEFFTGTLPHNWADMIALYGESIVTDNGIIPWVIEWWTDNLSELMSTSDWDEAWQVAAELGHYVADSHEPLHLTLNYNGQLTGNYGIHSRYETNMISPHLPQLPLPNGSGIYWENVIDSVFQYIDELYPYVSLIITADNLATIQDPTYGTTYYNTLWAQLDSITTDAIHRAILDLASIWQTAWVNVGSPIPPIESETIINVPADQSTIQAGIDTATDGDTVLVQPGTYVETINFNSKNIVVGSLILITGDDSYISRTVIDGDSSGSVVTFENGEDSTAVLCGFTITNGWAENGGGIKCLNSSPRIANVVISNNTVENGGAGMDNFGSSPTLINCIFRNNTAGNYGGGMSNDLSSPTLVNCTFFANTSNTGGGISNYTASDPILTNCTITDNIASNGGGMWNGFSFPILTNCILWGNTPEELSGDSSIITYSDVRGGYAGEGNINADPRFCYPDSGNFYLAENSPCIGAGGNGVNMGSFDIGCIAPLSLNDESMIPDMFTLHQNYPNPFNPITTIRYELPKQTHADLIIYDLLGCQIATLMDAIKSPGIHEIQWDAKDVSSGIYFYQLRTADRQITKKMLVMK